MKKVHVGKLKDCAECNKKRCAGCGEAFTLSTSDDPAYCSIACNPEEREKRKR
jgi:hypothetical protein